MGASARNEYCNGKAEPKARSLILWAACLLAMVICLAGATRALAAGETKKKDSVQLGEMTVSATKMTTEVNKVPTNIAVITREDIERYPSNFSVFDVLREANIPGVYMPFSAYGIDEDGPVSTRGGEVSAWGMRVLVNGIEFNKGNGYIVPPRLALHDIERIEVTKTPSAVYGDQALGGVINIITRVASKPVEAKVGMAYGGFGGGNGYGVINGSKGNWEYYLDASMKREDGYQDRTYMHDNTVYTRVNYNFNPGTRLAFHGSYFDTDSNYANGLSRAQFEQNPKQNPGPDYELKEKEKLAALDFSKMFGAHELKIKMEFKDELTNMYWYNYYVYDEWEAHPEINFTFNHKLGGMGNKLVVGGEYRYHKIHTTINQATSFTNIGALIGDRDREDNTWSCYLQDELSVTEALTVTAGLRYDKYKQEQTGKISSSNTWSQDNDAISPKLGLTYTVNQALNLFGGFNSGYKSPARVAAAATSGSLNPERLYAYEAGARGQITSWLNYNLAFFWQEVHDKFVRPSTEANAKYENAGKTRSTGVEAGVNANWENGLYASGSFTYQNSEFVEFTSDGVNYDGNKMNGVPEYLFSLYFGYRHDLLGDISLNPIYTGERYFDYANSFQEDGFWAVNVRYIKKFDRIELYAVANNIFDEQAVGCGSGSLGSETIYPYPGFNMYVGFNVNF